MWRAPGPPLLPLPPWSGVCLRFLFFAPRLQFLFAFFALGLEFFFLLRLGLEFFLLLALALGLHFLFFGSRLDLFLHRRLGLGLEGRGLRFFLLLALHRGGEPRRDAAAGGKGPAAVHHTVGRRVGLALEAVARTADAQLRLDACRPREEGPRAARLRVGLLGGRVDGGFHVTPTSREGEAASTAGGRGSRPRAGAPARRRRRVARPPAARRLRVHAGVPAA